MPAAIVRIATLGDVPGITACVCEAYVHYIKRIGKRPGPMLEDFQETIKSAQVHVVESLGKIVGVAVLMITAEGFYLDNVAVRPSATHELMHENRALYGRIGYKEYDSRIVGGYPRVFLGRQLQ